MMGNSVKTRLYLFAGSVITLLLTAAFLVVMNINEPAEYTAVPFNVLMVLVIISVFALAAFFSRGPVFNLEGKLEGANINAMLMAILIIIQVAFFFEIVSVRNQILSYQLFADIRSDVSVLDSCDEETIDDTLRDLCKDSITEVSILDENFQVIHSSNPVRVGEILEQTTYTYSYGKTGKVRFDMDRGYFWRQMTTILLNLLTVLVTSIFLSGEIILLMVRAISRNLEKVSTLEAGSEDSKMMMAPLFYIRQIAFLFYFASRLSSAFIPTMAKSLHSPLPFIPDTAAAGLPQSAETLLTCSAIFITTIILEKKGWKLPFMAGLFMVALGTFLSAVSPDLLVFVLARAVVGLGYGFCWMTLRNLSLFGKNDKEQLLGFALLNAGIYAGMNCGAALGAILADIFGFKTVFILSAALTLLTSAFIIGMENDHLPKTEIKENGQREAEEENKSGILTTVLFVVLMIAPASIAVSYTSYFLPLYFDDIGKSVTDVGRAQLLYGIAIVYAGPFLSKLISGIKGNALRHINVIYNMMIAVSLFLPGIGAGLILPMTGATMLGVADSFGFGVANNYFLSLSSVKKLGAAKSLSVLSFIKKMLEMVGPLVFAAVISLGFRAGIRAMAICFAVMAAIFMLYGVTVNKPSMEDAS